ncbi:MAG: LysR family transcriptional regulator [Candidatus Limnocylindria bacterium]
MKVERLAAFLEVARTGNLTRAARLLDLTQPALSERLLGLERDLETDLFVRTHRGVRLTDAGRALVPHAERAMAAIADGRRVVDELRRGEGGRLAVGAAPAVSTYVLPVVLRRFNRAHPEVELSVRTGHSEEVLDMVLREDVQVGVVRELRHPEVVTVPLYEDELVLVVPRTHRFAGRERIRIADLAQEHLVTFDRASSYTELTQALFREAGIVPRGTIELDNIDAAKKCVVQGLGVALLPRQAVREELAARTLRPVVIAGARPIRRRIVAVRRRDAGPAVPVVAAFLEMIRTAQAEPVRGSATA